MHERHILPTLAPLLISSAVFLDLWPVYFLFSLFSLFNLYYSFIWITQDFKTVFSDFLSKNNFCRNISGMHKHEKTG